MRNPADDLQTGALRSADDPAPQSALYALLGRLRSTLNRPFDTQAIRQLQQQIDDQSALVRQVEAALAGAEIFERAAAAARMGTWQCELPSEQLTWSNGTYDLFGQSRSRGLVRSEILKTYTEESLARLQAVRGKAIREEDGFKLDAEIESPEFGKRWIRISATIERRNGEPIRLFGIKQDITEEKKTLEHMRHLAEHDMMTGLANRTQVQVRLAGICGASGTGGALMLMLIDLDSFKEINDTYGHAFGDECLIEFTRRLTGTCQSADLIARIGGDEFAVLFGPSAGRDVIERVARHVVEAARMPMTCCGHTFNVSASVGFAFAEGETSTELFTRADLALYAAKAVGGDAFRGSAPA